MASFDSCYTFSEIGLAKYRRVFYGEILDTEIDLTDVSIALPIKGSRPLSVGHCSTAKDLARGIVKSLGGLDIQSLAGDIGLWCWLTFVYRHELFRRDAANGRWIVREYHRWHASEPGDWRKGQRHLVRMPVQLYDAFGKDADHLLCSAPSVLPEIREQLTSQQDMFEINFQRLARTLYFDDAKGALKKGVGGKGPGSARRLAQIKRQFDMTWDLGELELESLLKLLPLEFDKFRPPFSSS